MQSPTASDPSFKTFLEDLQKQNNQSFVTQIFQLKAEREIAGKDGDKREEQLHEINETLKTLKTAITGIKLDAPAIDFTPVVDSLSNVTEVLLKSLEEHSVIRKISEGRVKFDADTQRYHLEGKEAKNKMVKEADVRTTSTKDAMAAPVATRNRGPVNSKDLKIQGKVSEDASVEDIAAARGSVGPDRGSDLTEPALRLKPIKYTPGKATAVAVKGGKDKPADDTDDDLEKTKYQGLFNEIKSGFKFFMSNGLSEKPGYGAFQEPPKDVEKKEREAKVSSPRQENPEADNINTTGEIQADAAKSDLELSKQMLDTTREQLTVLKEIRDALAPKTPGELIQEGPKGKVTPEAKEEEGRGSLLGDLASGAMDLMGGGKKAAGKVAGKAAGLGSKILGGAQALGGKAVGFANSGAGKLLGSVAAVGLGAYTAYEGVTAAEDSKQAKMEAVQAKVDSGEMKPEEAAAARKEIGNSATVEKSGAVGEGTGMAAGAIAGAKLGATVGTFFGGPVGTAVGGLAGGALGAFAGSKAGNVVGEYGGKAINAAGSFFGGIGDKVKSAYGDAKTIYKDYNRGIGSDDQPLGTAMADMNMSVSKEFDTKQISMNRGPGFNATTTTDSFNQGIVGEKSILGSTTLGGLFTAKGKQSGKFLGTSSDEKIVEGKVEGRQINQTDRNYGTMLGKRISGGLFGKDTYSVSSEMSGTGGDSAEYDLEVSKGQYNELKELNKKGDVEGARKKLAEIKAKSAENAEALNIMSPEEMVSGASPILKGKDVVQASTENKDMERDAKGRGGANNTVVSNNVSSNNTTKIVPMKANPRPEYTGSALDRYTSRIAVY
jgi:hypothetical protein